MNAIIKKELRLYFSTPIAYVFIAVLVCVGAIAFTLFNLFSYNSSISTIFSLLTWVFVVMIPLLTMRLVAEERGLKTDQLLLTAPIKVSSIVWGKLISALIVFGIAVCLMIIFPVILSFHAEVEWGVVVSNYVGFFLLGSALISIGIFISSLTENQFTAGVTTIAVFLAMFLLASFGNVTGVPVIDKIISVFTISKRFDNFLIGIINLKDVVYFCSIVILFSYFTIYRIEKRRIA